VITRTSTVLLEGLKDSSSEDAWREFDARYRPLLLAVARRLGLDPVEAEDAVQETLTAFLIEYRQGRYSRDKGRLRDWLGGILTHKVRDAQRRQQRRRTAEPEAARAESVEATVHAALEQEWSAAVLRQCLHTVSQEVSPSMYESFELFVLQQRPAAEVAQRLGISPESVYQNKRRVLQRIRLLMPEMEAQW